MATLGDKIRISFDSSILFFIFNLPFISEIATSITGINFSKDGCTTKLGFLLNTLLFFTSTYFTMNSPKHSKFLKLKHTTYSSLIFFFLSNPTTLHVFNLFFESFVDCPKNGTIALHTIFYCILLVGVMYFPDK